MIDFCYSDSNIGNTLLFIDLNARKGNASLTLQLVYRGYHILQMFKIKSPKFDCRFYVKILKCIFLLRSILVLKRAFGLKFDWVKFLLTFR